MSKTRPTLIRKHCCPPSMVIFLVPMLGLYTSIAGAGEHLDCLIEPNLLVDVSSSEIGVLGSVRVDQADVVKQGEVLASLHTDVERAVLELSKARANAVAEIALLRRDYEFNTRKRNRIDKLHNLRAVSTQSVDEVRTTEDLARLRLKAATEKQRVDELEATRDALSLERRTVRSPIDGVVVQRYKSAGEYVDGVPILQLAQLDPLRVEVVAPISMFGRISVGMQATVLPELPMDADFEATVTSIDPIMDAATATFGVRLLLPNPEHRLPPGLKCTLVLHSERKPLKGSEIPPPAAQAQTSAEKEGVGDIKITPAITPSAKIQPNHEQQPTPLAVTLDVSPSVPQVESLALIDLSTKELFCATLGPSGSELQAKKIASRLIANQVNFERRYTSEVKGSGIWMVVSRNAYNAPAKLLARLKDAGVSDFQLFRKGQWRNRMSYGGYRGIQYAQRRLKAMNALGLDVELEQRGGEAPRTWFDLSPTPVDPVQSTVVKLVLDDFPVMTVRSIPCTQLASR